MSQTVDTTWKGNLGSKAMNEKFGTLISHGNKEGFECIEGSTPDAVTIKAGKFLTKHGELVTETADNPDYFGPGGVGGAIPENTDSSARLDLIVVECQYAERVPFPPATYHILEGAPGSLVLPTCAGYQTPLALAVIDGSPDGTPVTAYSKIAPWPKMFYSNVDYDSLTGKWKVRHGDSMALRIMVISQDMADVFEGWDEGLRVETVPAGTLSDGDEITEADWVFAFDLSQIMTQMTNHSWENIHAPGVYEGMEAHKTGDDPTATSITIEPGVIVTRGFIRVAHLVAVDLVIPPNTDLTRPRIDAFVARHAYLGEGPAGAPSLHILEGTLGALPVWPNLTDDDIMIGWGVINAFTTTYAAIFRPVRTFFLNCTSARPPAAYRSYPTGMSVNDYWHGVTITDGSMPAWIAEYTPDTSVPYHLTAGWKLYYNAGGVADGALIALTEVVGITEDGITEIVTARGSLSSLGARLNVSLEQNGTLKADTVGVTQITTAVAGAGLGGGGGDALFVKVDDAEVSPTLEIYAAGMEITPDRLRVKPKGIGTGQLADDLTINSLTVPAIEKLTMAALSELEVNYLANFKTGSFLHLESGAYAQVHSGAIIQKDTGGRILLNDQEVTGTPGATDLYGAQLSRAIAVVTSPDTLAWGLNIASVTHTGTGYYTILFKRAMIDSDYGVFISVLGSAGAAQRFTSYVASPAGMVIYILDETGAYVDNDFIAEAKGGQLTV